MRMTRMAFLFVSPRGKRDFHRKRIRGLVGKFEKNV